MHQIISGETHSIKVLDRSCIDNFLNKNKEFFSKIKKQNTNCLYKNKKVINDTVLNYLNTESNNEYIKNIIRKEFDICESIYPYLGDVLVNLIFDQMNLSTNKNFFLFTKKHQNKLIKSLNNESISSIGEYIFNCASLDYNIFINSYKGKDIIVQKKENIPVCGLLSKVLKISNLT